MTDHSKIDDHHVFPQAYLKELEVTESREIDCVLNRTLIPSLSNKQIGKKPPSAYLSELRKSNPKLSECLKNHAIDPLVIDGKYDQQYSEFCNNRAATLFNLINEHVIKPHAKLKAKLHPHALSPASS